MYDLLRARKRTKTYSSNTKITHLSRGHPPRALYFVQDSNLGLKLATVPSSVFAQQIRPALFNACCLVGQSALRLLSDCVWEGTPLGDNTAAGFTAFSKGFEARRRRRALGLMRALFSQLQLAIRRVKVRLGRDALPWSGARPCMQMHHPGIITSFRSRSFSLWLSLKSKLASEGGGSACAREP